MVTTRQYNETYYISRKKILDDFFQEEEKENLIYIESIENLVSTTKVSLKNVVMGECSFNAIKDKLELMEKDLNGSCENFIQSISTLNETEKIIEVSTIDHQKQEEVSIYQNKDKLDDLKRQMEYKEFKIQNMERLYVELENIIKDNIKNNCEQLLTLDQFVEFISQNESIKEECEQLEVEKKNLIEDYNKLLRENVNLRSKDESFELEKVKFALEEISNMGTLHAEAEQKINSLQSKFSELNKEYNALTEQIAAINRTLENLNIDNARLNKELNNININSIPQDVNEEISKKEENSAEPQKLQN
jgi:outer membrane murein-binding lipoprotein Lpp